jgi:exodeoxyribonuclease VII large subunit
MRIFQSLLFNNTASQEASPDDAFTVTAVTQRIKALLENEPELGNIRVAGELSNLARPASGHIYFTLKDAGAQIRCVMWRANAARLRATLRDGEAVIAQGRVTVYERDGQYQLVVESLTPRGVGDLYAEFERLKQKLQSEGLFDVARKRPLPSMPKRLGVVTSPSAAAFQDIQNVLRRRYPLVEVILAPTLVQGEQAPPQIVNAIELLNRNDACDVILVARGGGSIEELWAFNDERVVRAIAASKIPVVCGVGHEVDFTLADFAADVRAPTPSAAAEMLTPDIAELRQNVDAYTRYLGQHVQRRLVDERLHLDQLRRTLRMLSPVNQILRWRDQIEELRRRSSQAASMNVALWQTKLASLNSRLDAISPIATLRRGYAIVERQADGQIVRSVAEVHAKARLKIHVADGQFAVQVTEDHPPI